MFEMETTDYEVEALAKAAAEQDEKAAKAIAVEVERLEELIATARGYAPEAAIAEEFCRTFPPTEADYLNQMRSTVGTGSGSLNGFLIMWDVRRLADVKPRLSWLAQRLGKYTIDDYPELGRRTYDFGRLKFCVFFNSYDDKTICKFVEVGKKEEPIYKLMCGAEEVTEVI